MADAAAAETSPTVEFLATALQQGPKGGFVIKPKGEEAIVRYLLSLVRTDGDPGALETALREVAGYGALLEKKGSKEAGAALGRACKSFVSELGKLAEQRQSIEDKVQDAKRRQSAAALGAGASSKVPVGARKGDKGVSVLDMKLGKKGTAGKKGKASKTTHKTIPSKSTHKTMSSKTSHKTVSSKTSHKTVSSSR